MKGFRIGTAALVAALMAAPAGAENPRVSLRVQEATPAEALAQLSQASGVPVEMYTARLPQPAAAEKVSFDWSSATFARALREFCQRLQLMPVRRATGYVLYPSGNPAPPPAKKVGLFEGAGIRLFVRSVTINERRARNFAGPAVEAGDGTMTLQLGAELGEGDADAVGGVENVTARDDLGNLIVASPNQFSSGYAVSQYPDEWSGSVQLHVPHPKARKLQSVEGDLLLYRSVRAVRVEVPLPLPEKSTRRRVGDWLIAVSQYEPVFRVPEDDDEGLPLLGGGPPSGGPAVRVRVYYPLRSRVSSRAGWGYYPTLVTASGATCSAHPVRSQGAGNGMITMTDARLVFPPTPEAPAKLVWDLIERSDPARYCSFRLTEIPLPPPAPFVPRTVPPPKTGDGVDAPQGHPFYERGGGTLIQRVEIAGRAAAGGNLQLGLAPKSGARWGALRWVELTVGADGMARLPNLKPGVYRSVRLYRPAPGAESLPAGGRWQNPEAVITIQPGKECRPPGLAWTAAAPSGKAPPRADG